MEPKGWAAAIDRQPHAGSGAQGIDRVGDQSARPPSTPAGLAEPAAALIPGTQRSLEVRLGSVDEAPSCRCCG